MAQKEFEVAARIHAWERAGGFDYLLKQAFHREAKRALKAVAAALGLAPGSYDLRSNLAGPAVSGEVTLHTERLYIQVQGGFQRSDILYRTCAGRRDYTGGMNHFAPVEALDTPTEFAATVARLTTPKISLIA